MVCNKKLQVLLKRKSRAMTPKLKGTSPLFKKCALDTVTLHLNPFRATFLFKKAPTTSHKTCTVESGLDAVPPSAIVFLRHEIELSVDPL